jgi:hypothetical protein
MLAILVNKSRNQSCETGPLGNGTNLPERLSRISIPLLAGKRQDRKPGTLLIYNSLPHLRNGENPNFYHSQKLKDFSNIT